MYTQWPQRTLVIHLISDCVLCLLVPCSNLLNKLPLGRSSFLEISLSGLVKEWPHRWKIHAGIPNIPIEAHMCNPSTKRASRSEFPRACGQVVYPKTVSSGISKRSCLKKKKNKVDNAWPLTSIGMHMVDVYAPRMPTVCTQTHNEIKRFQQNCATSATPAIQQTVIRGLGTRVVPQNGTGETRREIGEEGRNEELNHDCTSYNFRACPRSQRRTQSICLQRKLASFVCSLIFETRLCSMAQTGLGLAI